MHFCISLLPGSHPREPPTPLDSVVMTVLEELIIQNHTASDAASHRLLTASIKSPAVIRPGEEDKQEVQDMEALQRQVSTLTNVRLLTLAYSRPMP
jgi:hypothetical protein